MVGTHNECSLARIRQNEEDVQNFLEMLDSDLLSNPFTKLSEDNKVMPLINCASAEVMPRPASEKLINAEELGTAQMKEFIIKHLKSNDISFWNRLLNKKNQFTKLTKARKVKVAYEKSQKTVSIVADRELFGRLIIDAKA